MTPAMRADAADALMRIEMHELGEKLIALSKDRTTPHFEQRGLRMISKAVERFELMAREIKDQEVAAAVAVGEKLANG